MSECENCGLSNSEKGRSICVDCSELQKKGITVSQMARKDLELVLAWRSNPNVYRHFQEQDGPIDWENHKKWFENRDSRRYDFLIEYSNRRVGVVSIDEENKVSIYIGDISARGNGIASASIDWLCGRFKHRTPIIAEVHQENNPSRELFSKCGFEAEEKSGEWIQYVYRD